MSPVSRVIDEKTIQGAYGLNQKHVLIHHEMYGHIYIYQGFGGVGSLEGGAYRWRHGSAFVVEDGSSLDELIKRDWDTVKPLCISGSSLRAIVNSALRDFSIETHRE